MLPGELGDTGLTRDLPVPQEAHRIGDFELVRELGRGSMGVVYEAHQLSLGRRVALKVFKAAGAKSIAVERFRREATAAAKLSHVGIVPVWAVGEDPRTETLFYAMQLVDGPSLRDFIYTEKPNPQRVARLAKRIAEALDYAHGQGVIHRDVKPANIIVMANDQPVLTDFGLAKNLALQQLTQAGIMLGTPTHMSPEQARGERNIDHRTDVYGLGACLYEMLTHRLPFYGESLDQLLKKVYELEPVRPRKVDRAVPWQLEAITLKCLAKDREERYDTCGEVARELDRFLSGEPVNARPPSALKRARRWARRHPRRAAGVIAALVLTVLVAGGLGFRAAGRRVRLASLEAEAESALASGDDATALARLDAMVEIDPENAYALQRRGDLAATRERLLAEGRREEERRQQEVLRERARAEARKHVDAGILALRRARVLSPGTEERQRVENEALNAFGVALALDADNRTALTNRAEVYLGRLGEAEAAGDEALALHFRRLVEENNRFGLFDEALEPVGRLAVASDPAGAVCQLKHVVDDGGVAHAKAIEAGLTTPFRRERLPRGSYVVEVAAPGYATATVPFVITRNQEVKLEVPLLAERAIPPGFVYIAPGPATLGGDPQAIRAFPREVAEVHGFLLARHEVTVREYVAFLDAIPERDAKDMLPRGGQKQSFAVVCWREEGRWMYPRKWVPDRPITGITWEAAVAYCEWRGRRDGLPLRLPTEREWEKACRGADGRPYPWGSASPEGRANVAIGSSPRDAQPVGSTPDDASIYGVLDLLGNAGEWTASGLDARLLHRIVRGGSWEPGADAPRAAARFPTLVDDAPHTTGFRLACDLPTR